MLALSLPVYCLSVAAGSWMEGLGRPRPVMVCMGLANLVNLAVNLALVPGAFGLPALGAQGASWATLGVALVPDSSGSDLRGPHGRRARARRLRQATKRIAALEAEQRRIGYGAGASSFFEIGAFSAMTFIAGALGALTVAAYTVVLNVVSFVFMVPLGLATATAVLVARAYGARKPAALNRAAFVGLSVTMLFGLLAGGDRVAVRPADRARLHLQPCHGRNGGRRAGARLPVPGPRRPAGRRGPVSARARRYRRSNLHALGELCVGYGAPSLGSWPFD